MASTNHVTLKNVSGQCQSAANKILEHCKWMRNIGKKYNCKTT